MGNARGFIEIRRAKAVARAASERVHDWSEFEGDLVEGVIREQGARCMDCGIPFCHAACPLGNVIPAWNELVSQGRWSEAFDALDATNNFPEVTGRVCPAPCEASCVLNLESIPGEDGRRAAPGAVTIKQIERQVADRAIELDLVRPRPASVRTGRRVAVVGSGPAGLACAQELARKGHDVTVFEKDDRVGGLLRYGIPDFKLDKALLDRRIEQMTAEGVSFRTRVNVGVDMTGAQLRSQFDAIVLCGGAMVARPLDLAEPCLRGVHYAMEFLTQQNRVVAREAGDALAGDDIAEDARITATGRDVVILGGGDTGSDCVGTSLRQGARSVTSFELMPRPPDLRATDNPWPAWPLVFRTSSSHEEGGARDFGVMTTRVLGDGRGHVRALEAVRVERMDGRLVPIEGSRFEVPCDLLLLAMGFVGSRREGLLEQLGVAMDARGNVTTTDGATSVEGVFAAGDMARGQSLVVWAIAEGRKAAARVDAWLATRERFRNTAP